MTMTFRNANTPKAFHNTAQRRSRATLGNGGRQPLEPCQGSTTRTLAVFRRIDDCSTLSGLWIHRLAHPGCAHFVRNPGLWCETPSA